MSTTATINTHSGSQCGVESDNKFDFIIKIDFFDILLMVALCSKI